MLGCYFYQLNQLNRLSEPMNLSRMAQLVPAVATRDKVVRKEQLAAKQIQRRDDRINTPLVVATHLAYSSHKKKLIFSSKDIIFLVRNIYDVLVSQYFERVHRKGDDNTDDIWGYICKRGLVEAYVSYLNGWAKNLEPERHSKHSIVLTYENLKRDTEKELARVLQFLDLEVIPDYVTQAVEMSSFENMQTLQLQTREEQGIDDAQTNYAGLRTRRGKIGGYRDYLDESSIRSIHHYCQVHLNSAAQDLLIRNGIEF
jgi:alcohol sulfotransferase